MKKFLSLITVFALTLSMSVSVFANNYNFSSGADSSSTFGKSTSTDNPVKTNPETENVRRNKDAALFAPAYGVFSGDIPTDRTSLYHDNTPAHAGTTSVTFIGDGGFSTIDFGGSVSPNTGTDFGGMLAPTSMYSPDIVNTMPLFYDDGSIGTLQIPKISVNVKVYEGETLDNMKIGVGRFVYTSAWDGTVGFAGHNRGASAHFGGVKNLSIGDTLTYTTKYGTRTYEIFSKEQIKDTDYSALGWSAENIAVLITCVENQPTLRWCVMAREIR